MKRLRYVTENYTHLQGLRLLPFGLFFLAKGMLGQAFTNTLVVSVTLATAVLLFYLIGRYYESRLGRVRRETSALLKDGVAALVCLVVISAGVQLEIHYTMPVSTVSLAVAGLFFYIHLHSAGQRHYYGLMAVLFLLVGLLPATGWVSSREIFGVERTIGDFLLAGAYIVGGVLDHLFLIRTFPAQEAQEESDDDAF
ncbi:MAG TPA: hypothetical protein VLU25_13825 [Acidobacteriota bacterium]|nr:hypothetical protein [Acidobacteriota bacterium]